MKKKIAWLVVSCMVVLSLIVASCGPAEEQKEEVKVGEAVSGGTLKIGVRSLRPNLGDPKSGNGPPTGYDTAFGIEKLINIDENGKPVPNLCTSWEFSPDGKILTLKLMKGVKFQDDTPFDAEAVKYNLEVWKASPNVHLKHVTSIDIIDTNTVRLTCSEFRSYLLYGLASTVGMMISPTAQKTKDATWLANNPVGTGPFKNINFTADVSSTWARWDGFREEGKPYLDGVELYSIPDTTVLTLTLMAGDVDAGIDMWFQDLPKFIADGRFIVNAYSGGIKGLAADSANPDSPFADIKVRQAVSYAIKRDDVPTLVGYGAAGAQQFCLPGTWGYNPDIKGYPYDPQKAMDLLEEAGYPNGFKCVLEAADTCEPEWYAGVQGYLRAVGIDAELVQPVWASHWAKLQQEGWTNGLMDCGMGGSFWSDPIMQYQTNMSNASGSHPKSVTYPDDYEALLAQAVTEPNDAKREEMAKQLAKMLVDDYCLAIPLYNWTTSFVSYKYVHHHIKEPVGTGCYPRLGNYPSQDIWMEAK